MNTPADNQPLLPIVVPDYNEAAAMSEVMAAEAFASEQNCVVTFARIGYALRPTAGNWRNEVFQLATFTALSTAFYSFLVRLVHPCFIPVFPGALYSVNNSRPSRFSESLLGNSLWHLF
jgi:hypothetical protein